MIAQKVHIEIRAIFHKNSVVNERLPQTIKKNSIDFVMQSARVCALWNLLKTSLIKRYY